MSSPPFKRKADPDAIAGFVTVPSLHLARIEEAYEAGKFAVRLYRTGLPAHALAERWTAPGVADDVRRAFYQGVEDA